MTIPSTPRKAGPLLGTGAQTAWPFTFKVFEAADRPALIAYRGPFDGFHALPASVSKTLLVRFDYN